jgi:pimeloyl-ACP methyl ester carboxylesterase
MDAYAAELLPKMVAAATPPQVAEHVSDMMRSAPAEGAAAALRGRAERPDYLDMLPKIAISTLVVVGAEDEFTPVAEAELMAGRICGATLTVIDGAGHLPNLERPAEFNAALDKFLSGFAATT